MAVSTFLSSVIAVKQNAVKSVLFRCAALLLQLAVYKFFCFIAYQQRAFTSYLMFAEHKIQQLYFVLSRKLSRNGVLVLSLSVLLLVAGLYDTLLWSLDKPGYIAAKKLVRASEIAGSFLERPAYVITYKSAPGSSVAELDTNLVEIMGANMFKPGENITLQETVDRGTRNVLQSPKNRTLRDTGPRIWLDDDGFSVTTDLDIPTGKDFCATVPSGEDQVMWRCNFNNSQALPYFQKRIGQPLIFYDEDSEIKFAYQFIPPMREDNIWFTLGAGGDAAWMSQVFTITKGRERHTFVLRAFKATMVSIGSVPLAVGEIQDLVKRTYPGGPESELGRTAIDDVNKFIIDTQKKDESGMFGVVRAGNFSVSQINYELLNIEADVRMYSALRFSSVNLTLIRSDVLPTPVTPFGPCDRFYQNEATGGKVERTSCYRSLSGMIQDGHRFLGQVDTSSVFIIAGILGDGSTNTSTQALDQSAYSWVSNNAQRFENLLLERGFILGLDPKLVTVETSTLQPAISYLQVLLVVVPVLLAAVGWTLVRVGASDHYSSSLLGNLCATTSAGEEMDSRKPQYLKDAPEISLREEEGKVVLVTATGCFGHALVVRDGDGDIDKAESKAKEC
ncbi:hypothetical protein K440DRAFT_660670 [Wilcoxina mikolae CBS 423.85]|nr:hypothetical protein K440DRAFT_660670 [Wilcoxina mikolae CBS 423.85]